MRVIAGEFRGRKLAALKGTVTRPTADRVKEAIFSMVQEELPGSVCLDLFAGTGALGIEALSRGATRVIFCDKEGTSLATLQQNLNVCRLGGDRVVIMKSDWQKACKIIKEKCNLVFIDAPYDMCVYYSQIIEILAAQKILDDNALVVIERDFACGRYELPEGFSMLREKRYGSVGIDVILYNRPETDL